MTVKRRKAAHCLQAESRPGLACPATLRKKRVRILYLDTVDPPQGEIFYAVLDPAPDARWQTEFALLLELNAPKLKGSAIQRLRGYTAVRLMHVEGRESEALSLLQSIVDDVNARRLGPKQDAGI